MKTTTPATTKVPPVLFALGLLIEGEGTNPKALVGWLTEALDDADRVLATVMSDDGAQNVACDVVFDRAKHLLAGNGGSDGEIVEAVNRALLLGAALAYRFQSSGAK